MQNLPDSDERFDPWPLVTADASTLRHHLGDGATSAVVLGSGWARVGAALGDLRDQMPMDTLDGVPEPTVAGHGGTISLRDLDGKSIMVLSGRSHLYEGHSVHSVVHAVRCAVLAGCRSVLLTNAAGSLRTEVGVGRPVVIADQINLTGANPMTGPAPPDRHGARFVDLSNLYSPRLRTAALEADDGAVEGVYAGVLGASFETPAEIRMLAAIGADVVGMSTVLESIAARHLGAEVFAVSLVTNLAAGLQDSLDHEEVLAAGAAWEHRLGDLLRSVLSVT